MPTKTLSQKTIDSRRARYDVESESLCECRSCHEMKAVKEFYFNKARSVGHDGTCKKCAIKRLSDYTKNNPERNRRRNAAKSKKIDKTDRKHALRAIMYAIKCGALKKPETCSVCGKTSKVEAHHNNGWDSIEHLFIDIQWVCRECHMSIHAADWIEYSKRPPK